MEKLHVRDKLSRFQGGYCSHYCLLGFALCKVVGIPEFSLATFLGSLLRVHPQHNQLSVSLDYIPSTLKMEAAYPL